MKYIDTGKYLYVEDGYVTDKEKRDTYFIHNINYLLWALNQCGYPYRFEKDKEGLIKPNPLFRDHVSSYHPYNRRLGVGDYGPRPPKPPKGFKREIKIEPKSRYSTTSNSFSSESYLSLKDEPLFSSERKDLYNDPLNNWSVQPNEQLSPEEEQKISEDKAAAEIPFRSGPLYPVFIPEKHTNPQLYPRLSGSKKRAHEEDDQAAFLKSMENFIDQDDRNQPNRSQLVPSKKTKKSKSVLGNLLPDPNPIQPVVPQNVKPKEVPADEGTHMIKPKPQPNLPMPQNEPDPVADKPPLPGRNIADFQIPDQPAKPTTPPPTPLEPPKKGFFGKLLENLPRPWSKKDEIIEEVKSSIDTADDLFTNNLGLKNLEVKDIELDLENKNPNVNLLESLGSEEEISPKRVPSNLLSEDLSENSLFSNDLSKSKSNIRQNKLNEKQIKNSIKAIQQMANLSKSRINFLNQNIEQGVAERLARIPENAKEQKRAFKKLLEVSPGKTKMSANQKKKIDNLINELYHPDKEAPRPPVEIKKFTNLEQIDIINKPKLKPKEIPKPKPIANDPPPVQINQPKLTLKPKPIARNNAADRQGPPVKELGGLTPMRILNPPPQNQIRQLPTPQIKKPNPLIPTGAIPKANQAPILNIQPPRNPLTVRRELANLPIRQVPVKQDNKVVIKNPSIIAEMPGQDLQLDNYTSAEILGGYRDAMTELFNSYSLLQPKNLNIQNAIFEEVLPGGIGPEIDKTPKTIQALVNRHQRPLATAKYKPKYLNLWVDVQGRHDTAFDPAISSFSANMDALDIVAEQLKLFINFLDTNNIKRMDNHIEKNMKFLAESSKNALSKLNESLRQIQRNATPQSEDFILRVNGIFDSTRRNLLQAFTHYFDIPWTKAEEESINNVNFQYSVLSENLLLPPKVINELGISIIEPNPNVPQNYKEQFEIGRRLFNILENETLNFFMKGDIENYDAYVTTLQEAEQTFQAALKFVHENLTNDPTRTPQENKILFTYRELLKYCYILGIDTAQRLMKSANQWRKDPTKLFSEVENKIPINYNELPLNLGDQIIVKLNVNDQDQSKWINVNKFRIPIDKDMSLYYDRAFSGKPKRSSGKVAFLMTATSKDGRINRDTVGIGKMLESKRGKKNKVNFTKGFFKPLPTIIEEQGGPKVNNNKIRARYGKFGRGIYIQSNSPLDYIDVISKHYL